MNLGTTGSFMNTTMSTVVFGNSTRDTIFANIYSALNLTVLVPIIVAVAILLSITIYAIYKSVPDEEPKNSS
jgi:hypothetical protein